jgi:hypothetical protein
VTGALLALAGGCSPRREDAGPLVVHEEQPFAPLVSSVAVGDPKLAGQLLKGWHTIEEGTWRWTERQFSAVLKTPSAGQAATLELKFALPDPSVAKLRSVTLSAKLNGTALPAETYQTPGEHTYRRTVATLSGDVARVDFELDRALAPTDADRRELGLVVTSVGLR